MTPHRIRRIILDNGLRVLLAPDDATPAVGIAVHYAVGFRTEPAGRSGLAHLFEHLVFQGGGSVPRGDHLRLVQDAGGRCDASTRQDVTVYHSTAPAPALDLLLFLEAERMRAPHITEENLRSQTAVIGEEIGLALRNRPYGCYPWILPKALFSRSENTRDGYGETADLAAVELSDCREFFARYYAPANAHLTLAGGFDPGAAAALVRRHFGRLPGREPPPAPRLAEPPARERTRTRVTDPHARMPALGAALPLPDPATGRDAYLAHLALASLLSQGGDAPLRRRLRERASGVTSLSVGCGLFGVPMETRGPDLLTVFAVHGPPAPRPAGGGAGGAPGGADAVLTALDEEVAEVAERGPEPDRLGRVTARWAAAALRELGDPAVRARLLGTREVLFGEAELTDGLPRLLRERATPERVRDAAAALRSHGRAAVLIDPAAGAAA